MRFRQGLQVYLGLFEGTYIFLPHSQYVTPEKRWTVGLVCFWSFARCRSRMWLQAAHSSSETMAGASRCTHSDSGFSTQARFLPSGFFV